MSGGFLEFCEGVIVLFHVSLCFKSACYDHICRLTAVLSGVDGRILECELLCEKAPFSELPQHTI